MSAFDISPAGLSRRRFLHGAALSGAAAMSAPSILAQSGGVGEAGDPVVSLIRPEAPAQPDAVPLAPPDKQPPNLEVPEPRRKLGWAIVGLGQLALGEIMPAFGSCKDSKPTALVSGHPEKARKVAEVYGVDSQAIYDYEDFDRIRDNAGVDIVYIVLPNSMHAEFTIRALEAGKHVLCEKPMAVTVEECERMIEAAKKADRKLGVAYRLHYEPRNLAVMEMCREKKYGDVKTFTGSFCQNVQAPNIRLSGPLGGGPLGDMGVYCINAARYTIGEEPLEAIGTQVQPKSDPRFREVPETISFLLRYASGAVAECECSLGTSRKSNYEVLCTGGSILMNPAYDYRGLRLFTNEVREGTAVQVQHLIPDIDQFAAEMDAFSAAVEKNGPVSTPGGMGLADMRIVLAVLESIRRGGGPVKIGEAPI